MPLTDAERAILRERAAKLEHQARDLAEQEKSRFEEIARLRGIAQGLHLALTLLPDEVPGQPPFPTEPPSMRAQKERAAW